MEVRKQFFKYVSFNMLATIGSSCYCLADTFFIANGVGVDGLTALNLVMPIYNVIFAFGLLLGVGGGTCYSIHRAKHDRLEKSLFTYAINIGIIIAIPLMIICFILANNIVEILGADSYIKPIASEYLRGFILFTPFFILSQILCAFIRNDDNPRLASIAGFSGTTFNIIFDYILIFPMHLGMLGAALATGMSPVITISICSLHFIKKHNHFNYKPIKFNLNSIKQLINIGIPSFITELSAGIIILAFNWIILPLSGNTAIASFSILSNLSILVMGLYNGIAQGIQPLLSTGFGAKDYDKIKKLFHLAIVLSLVISIIMISIMIIYPSKIVALFNSENNKDLAAIAIKALPLYFSAFFFIGINLILVSYFASTNRVLPSSIISILRSGLMIVPVLIILSKVWNMTGVWLSYPISEFMILIVGIVLLKKHAI